MLSSMTGFSHVDGHHNGERWTWDVKTVNHKGFDLRLRLAAGCEAIEQAVREHIARVIRRGSVVAALSLTDAEATGDIRINEAALETVLVALEKIRRRTDAEPPRLDGLLSLRGVVEYGAAMDEGALAARQEAMLATLDEALDSLLRSRQEEGAALQSIMSQHLDSIFDLIDKAEACPARQPAAIQARLEEQIKMLLGMSMEFDAQRLHQEAVLIASRADIREEIDRLRTHAEAARKLVGKGGVVGRRLDFLAQELNREANTLCSKANDATLSAIGLDLRAVVDQLREQVQNLE